MVLPGKVPCDLVLLQGNCLVEESNLSGEVSTSNCIAAAVSGYTYLHQAQHNDAQAVANAHTTREPASAALESADCYSKAVDILSESQIALSAKAISDFAVMTVVLHSLGSQLVLHCRQLSTASRSGWTVLIAPVQTYLAC